MKYSVVTFGCRVNQADSLRLEQDLLARGAEASPADTAELVIVNSCTVTATADQGVRQAVRRLARTNRHARIVVTGCYATRRPAEIGALPNVLRVVPNDRKEQLLADVADALGAAAARFGAGGGPCGTRLEPGVAGRTAYTLRVQTGCEERCTYCVIPATRGRSRSVPVPDVRREVECAARAGFREVAVTGVHLGSYGRDLWPRTTLAGLLRSLLDVPGDLFFRLSSLEPMDCDRDVVDLVAGSDRFAPHFHLPLQHASDRLLRRMGRPYSIDQFSRLVDRVRHRIPHAAIGSDLIVGFPGESDEDFEACERYLPGSPLTHLHVFPYSDRPGTSASRMAGRPPAPIVRARSRRLREIGDSLAARFRQTQVGGVRPGLTLADGSLVVTDNFLKVRIPPGFSRNQRVRVRIEDTGCALHGQVVG